MVGSPSTMWSSTGNMMTWVSEDENCWPVSMQYLDKSFLFFNTTMGIQVFPLFSIYFESLIMCTLEFCCIYIAFFLYIPTLFTNKKAKITPPFYMERIYIGKIVLYDHIKISCKLVPSKMVARFSLPL